MCVCVCVRACARTQEIAQCVHHEKSTRRLSLRGKLHRTAQTGETFAQDSVHKPSVDISWKKSIDKQELTEGTNNSLF